MIAHPRIRRPNVIFVAALLVALLTIATTAQAQSTAGTHDDPWQLGRISYRPMPNWYQYGYGYPGGPCDYCMWNTQSLSSSSGYDEIDFTFTGSTLSWFNTMAYNRRTKWVQIYYNGTSVLAINEFSLSDATGSDVRRQIGKTVYLPYYGTYRVIIQNRGAGLMDLDSFAVDIQQFSPGVYKYNDPAGQVRFIGPWTDQPFGAKSSSTQRALARLTTNGESITVVFVTGPNKGQAVVTLDGGTDIEGYPVASGIYQNFQRTVDLYNPVTGQTGVTFNLYRSYYPFYAPYASPHNRVHIINITVLGQKNIFSSGYEVPIKSVDVGYTGAGYFTDGSGQSRNNLTWKYTGIESDAGGSYRIPAANAVATWSNNTNINLSEVPSYASADITVEVGNFGSGFSGRAIINNNIFASLEERFLSCKAQINVDQLATKSQAQRQNVTAHELGHCFSLQHRSEFDSIVFTNQDNPQSVTSLNPTDIYLVNSRYR
jgi:hypothetical protein